MARATTGFNCFSAWQHNSSAQRHRPVCDGIPPVAKRWLDSSESVGFQSAGAGCAWALRFGALIAGPAFRDLLVFRPARNQAERSVLKELSVQPDQAKKPSLEISSWWGRVLVGRRPQWTLARVATLVVVIFVLFKFVYIAIRIEGNSMAPTYRSGRPNLINKLAYRWHEPRRGDVVAVRAEGTYLVLLKRIVGLPGERIAIRQGKAIVNGQPLTEPYASGRDISTPNEILLGHDEYFVIGDNREVSIYFTVHRREILGKTVL